MTQHINSGWVSLDRRRMSKESWTKSSNLHRVENRLNKKQTLTSCSVPDLRINFKEPGVGVRNESYTSVNNQQDDGQSHYVNIADLLTSNPISEDESTFKENDWLSMPRRQSCDMIHQHKARSDTMLRTVVVGREKSTNCDILPRRVTMGMRSESINHHNQNKVRSVSRGYDRVPKNKNTMTWVEEQNRILMQRAKAEDNVVDNAPLDVNQPSSIGYNSCLQSHSGCRIELRHMAGSDVIGEKENHRDFASKPVNQQIHSDNPNVHDKLVRPPCNVDEIGHDRTFIGGSELYTGELFCESAPQDRLSLGSEYVWKPGTRYDESGTYHKKSEWSATIAHDTHLASLRHGEIRQKCRELHRETFQDVTNYRRSCSLSTNESLV